VITETGGLLVTGTLASEPGAYETFYRQMALAIRGEGEVPVRAEEARDTIRVLEAALASSRDGRVVSLC
jgi:scyllo-inositol 2-dehydrogenase (NADP+)